MNREEENRELYKGTFEELPVPERLVEKVGKISEGTEKRKRTVAGGVMRKVAIAAAILVALFVGSNGVAYAMTGETWLESLLIRVAIEGEEYDVQLREQMLRNGETIYIGDIENESGVNYQVQAYEQGQKKGSYFEMAGAEIWVEDDSVCLWDGDVEIDITEDFEDDGKASGTYEVNGILKGYKLWKTEEGVGCWVEILHDGEKETFWIHDWME